MIPKPINEDVPAIGLCKDALAKRLGCIPTVSLLRDLKDNLFHGLRTLLRDQSAGPNPRELMIIVCGR